MSNRKTLTLAVAAATAVWGQQALAQNNSTETLEEVVVTGSRILRNPLNEAAPVMDISSEDMERTGLTNIGAILQQLPMAGSAINSKFNVPGNSGFPQDGSGIGAGAAQISLRNVGAKRTLVLVDGKRWVAGASASGVPNAVDLNSIPANVIQKMEILQDGASAVYGSDAIGGVVNIITNANFEGFKLSTQTGEYISENDGKATELSLLWGGGNDTTHLVFSANYVEEEPIFTASRDISAYPNAFAGTCDVAGSRCSSFTPQARVVLGPAYGYADITLNNGASLVPTDPNDPLASGIYHGFTSADRFNYNGEDFNYLTTPNKRTNFYTSLSHKLAEDLTLKVKASYTNRKSATKAAPEPLCFGNGCGNAILDNIVIDADQQYNPFGIDLTIADGSLEFIGRRPVESGPRIFEQDVDTLYFSAGVEGAFTLNDKNFNWDLYANFGDNSGFQQKFNSHNAAKLAVALGDPSVCEATPNCVPFNLFGGEGTITEEMLDFIGYTQRDYSEQTLFDLVGNITGVIADMSAGPLAFAAGFEYRDHEGRFIPDPVAARGETAGIPSGGTEGAFDVTEYYAEINAPLIANVSGAKYLEVNAAIRSSDYSNFGTESTYKVGFLYQPTENLSLRGSVSTGIRAPGIGELFGGAAREDFTFTDPCATAAAPANCSSLVPAGYSQLNPQLTAVSAGNEDLVAETSDSTTFGIVYNPGWVDGADWVEDLTLTLDWYDIEIEDAIQGRNPADVINACINTLDPFFCNDVNRAPSGQITLVNNKLQNIGLIDASGMDIGLSYLAPASDLGQMRLRINATQLDEYTEYTRNADGSVSKNELTGTITSETFQRAFPEWRSTVNFDWMLEEWLLGVTLRYVGDMDQPSGNTLGSATFTDAMVQYRSQWDDSNFSITLGANNLFDTDVDACDACGATNISAVVHDLPGTVAYLRFTLEM